MLAGMNNVLKNNISGSYMVHHHADNTKATRQQMFLAVPKMLYAAVFQPRDCRLCI